MGVIARTFAASPARSSSQTWEAISKMVEAKDTAAAGEFRAVKNVAASILNSEAPKDQPIVVSGAGALLKIYCLYGDDALDGDDTNESALSWNPFSAEWKVVIPCQDHEIQWMEKVLSGSKYFSVYNVKDGYDGDLIAKTAQEEVEMDLGGLRNL
jgi:hypothetical protein